MKDLKDETEKLVEYIRKNSTSENPWVIIKHREIPQITGESQFYSRKLIDLLRMHPHVLSEITSDYGTRMKPYRFRIVTEKQKLRAGLTSSQFSNLTDEEIQYYLNKPQFADKDYYYNYHCLLILNYIASLGARTNFIELTVKQIADIAVASEEFIQEFRQLTLDAGILVHIEETSLYRICLNDQDYINAIEAVRHPIVPVLIEPVKKEKKPAKIAVQSTEEKEGALPQQVELKDEEKPIENAELIRDLRDFREYFDQKIQHLSSPKVDETKERQLKESHAAATRLIAESKKQQDEISRLRVVNHQLMLALEKEQGYREEFFEAAQRKLEVFYAEVLSNLNDYTKIPAWKIKPETTAALQKRIIDSLTVAIDEMLQQKKTNSATKTG